MPNPTLIIYPNEFSMLEVGVRVQQLLLLHPHAVRWVKPLFVADQYESLIMTLWKRLTAARLFPKRIAGSLDEGCVELLTAWQSAVKHSFDCFYLTPKKSTKTKYINDTVVVTPQMSTITTYFNDIVMLIEQELQTCGLEAAWYRLGRYSVEGKFDQTKWILANEDAF